MITGCGSTGTRCPGAVVLGARLRWTMDSSEIPLSAMRRAMAEISPDYLLIDGNQPVPCEVRQESLVKGDSRCYSIAAASILAKVHRDRLLVELDAQFPHYGFAGHKGYPTRSHREAIARHGPCPEHRRTFRGVKEFL